MKAPEELDKWRKRLIKQIKEDKCAPIGTPYYNIEVFNSMVREIRLDAVKEGMKRAARIADEAQYKTEPRDCMIAILTAAEQLTEKDL